MKKQLFFHLALCLLTFGCQTYQAKPYDFPTPVDTHTRPIEVQNKQIFAPSEEGIFADNRFDGARLNDFQKIGDNTFQATISPENLPINSSPYYAFRLWAEQPRDIVLELNYTEAKHRYHPKVSTDGQHWQLLDSNLIQLAADTVNAFLSLSLGRVSSSCSAASTHRKSLVILRCKPFWMKSWLKMYSPMRFVKNTACSFFH